MIAGIEAFRRRRGAFVPSSPVAMQVQGMREVNRGVASPISPMSPQETSIAANETTNAAFRVTPARTDEPDEAITACLPTDEAEAFWSNFLARVDRCDFLVHALCDARKDTEKERADLLATRKRTSPANLDSDIAYLTAEIATLTPAPPEPTTGRCIECQHFVRFGVGERCSHPDRSPPGEPPRAACMPANSYELFIHWRPLQSRNSIL